MRRHSAHLLPHLGLLTLSLSLLGCGPTLPPAQTPDNPTPPQSEIRPLRDSGEAPIPKAFTSGGPSTPVDMRSDAPPPDAQPQGDQLAQPGQPSMSLGDLQGGLPGKIPQGMAGALLRPLDGPIADVRAPGPGIGDGCAYGALPDLVDYGVYPRLLYYSFRNCWVPYILVDDCYYPYVYQPYFETLFSGYCYYPLFVFRHGYYYPYYFHSRSYYYGYLDWEYNWPHYRDRHGDYDWSEIGRRHPRRYNDDDFQAWRDGKIRQRDRGDWQREEPPRKRRGDVERGAPQQGPDLERSMPRPRDNEGPRQEGRIQDAPERGEAKAKRREQVAEGGERTRDKRQKERAEGQSVKQQKKEGRKGGRRLQAEEEDDEQEQLD